MKVKEGKRYHHSERVFVRSKPASEGACVVCVSDAQANTCDIRLLCLSRRSESVPYRHRRNGMF